MQSYTFIPTSANHFHLCRPPKENIGSIYFEKQKLIKENKQTPDSLEEIQSLLVYHVALFAREICLFLLI